jgi:hypothetical protein
VLILVLKVFVNNSCEMVSSYRKAASLYRDSVIGFHSITRKS